MSDTNAVPAADAPFFRALLKPHRSLGRVGFAVLMASLLVGWIAVGAIFLAHGAWPVFGFLGLDVLLLYVAFRINYRAARRYEEVSVSRTELFIRKVAPSGRAEQHWFNPFWARFSVVRRPEIGVASMAVEAKGQRVALGSFLNAEDRESFAAAFSRALATARGR